MKQARKICHQLMSTPVQVDRRHEERRARRPPRRRACPMDWTMTFSRMVLLTFLGCVPSEMARMAMGMDASMAFPALAGPCRYRQP
jgi:PAB1-binding protein PBP1